MNIIYNLSGDFIPLVTRVIKKNPVNFSVFLRGVKYIIIIIIISSSIIIVIIISFIVVVVVSIVIVLLLL